MPYRDEELKRDRWRAASKRYRDKKRLRACYKLGRLRDTDALLHPLSLLRPSLLVVSIQPPVKM